MGKNVTFGGVECRFILKKNDFKYIGDSWMYTLYLVTQKIIVLQWERITKRLIHYHSIPEVPYHLK